MNFTFRLHRYIPGETLLVEREIVRRTRRLDVVKPSTLKAWEPKRLPTHATRRTRNVVDAGPNAPQMKRLIQYPYAQSTTHPRPGKPWRQRLGATLELRPTGLSVQEAMADGQRPRWPKATRSVFGPQPRPRPSVADYLNGQGEQ